MFMFRLLGVLCSLALVLVQSTKIDEKLLLDGEGLRDVLEGTDEMVSAADLRIIRNLKSG